MLAQQIIKHIQNKIEFNTFLFFLFQKISKKKVNENLLFAFHTQQWKMDILMPKFLIQISHKCFVKNKYLSKVCTYFAKVRKKKVHSQYLKISNTRMKYGKLLDIASTTQCIDFIFFVNFSMNFNSTKVQFDFSSNNKFLKHWIDKKIKCS